MFANDRRTQYQLFKTLKAHCVPLHMTQRSNTWEYQQTQEIFFLSPPSDDRLEMDVSSERATLDREWLRNALYSKHQPSPDVLSFVPNASNNIQRSENCKTRTDIAIMADVHFVKCFTPAAKFWKLNAKIRTTQHFMFKIQNKVILVSIMGQFLNVLAFNYSNYHSILTRLGSISLCPLAGLK